MDKKLEIYIYGVLFVIILFYSAVSIHEFIARDNYQVFLNSEINRIEIMVSGDDNNLTSTQIDSLKKKLSKLHSFANDLKDLNEFGSGPLHLMIRKIRYDYYKEFGRIEDEKFEEQPLSIMWKFILTWPKDILLIFTIILCGAMGAIIRAFIYNLEIQVYKITIGIAAAFISYFAIQSGDFIFLETEGIPTQLNPYTLAVLAVLSGLFSERVFNYFKNRFFTDKDLKKNS